MLFIWVGIELISDKPLLISDKKPDIQTKIINSPDKNSANDITGGVAYTR